MPTDLSFSLSRNKTPRMISIIARPTLPKKVKGFLPTLISTKMARMVAIPRNPFMMSGTFGANSGTACYTILRAEVTIALMPVICCMKGS